jgi:pimeloyl-ACP methyl ester carboxylesterase
VTRELAYVEAGTGDPLVFVHGSVSDHRTWQGQVEAHADRFRTIAYSRRYHWPNPPIADGADYAMGEHVDDLASLLERLDATPAHLVGHSYGALVCLLLAMRSPQRVKSLVLIEPPAITLFVSDPPKPHEILKLLLARPRTAVGIVRLGATGFAPATAAVRKNDPDKAIRHLGRATLGAETFARLSRERLEQVRANLIGAELLGSGYPPLAAQDVRRIEVPVLLVSAHNSPRVFHRLADRLEELLPRCTRIEIPEASHIVHEDNAPAFTAAVRSFVERV